MHNLKTAEAFVEVVRLGSFAAAARRLNLSTSSISRLVNDLEDWLQTPLLRRTTRQLTLTDAGELYFERCRQIVSDWNDLGVQARTSNHKPRGKLHIAGAAYPMRLRIAPHLPRFLQLYPDVQLELHLHDKAMDLVGEGIDVAIRIGALEDSSLIARKCGEVRLQLVASPGFLDRRGLPQSLDDLPSFPCLVDMTASHGRRWPIGRRVHVDGPLAANDGEIIRTMALAGLGIAILPDFFVETDIAEGRLIHLFKDALDERIGLYTLLPVRKQITPAARAFADFIAMCLAKKTITADLTP